MEECELLQSIQVVSYFVNPEGTIERISERNQPLSKEGVVEKQELIKWVQDRPKGFKLSSMGLFHMNDVDVSKNIHPINFERITMEPSLSMLHDLSTLYLIFTRYSSGKNKTRKIRLHRHIQGQTKQNKFTRRRKYD
jgi:hypothetical protein